MKKIAIKSSDINSIKKAVEQNNAALSLELMQKLRRKLEKTEKDLYKPKKRTR
jgi:hypothetical protein